MFGITVRDPEEVFTPRGNFDDNRAMYVPRSELETQIVSALKGTQHIIVHGDSGCGKTWLYKKILKDIKAFFLVANMANASRYGSINQELKDLLDENRGPYQVGYSVLKKGEANIGLASGGAEHEKSFMIPEGDSFRGLLKTIRDLAGSRCAILIFDNLERIFDNPKIMSELADLITLIDDDRYCKYRVRILIVGVPAGIKEYFAKTPNRQTVSNRIYEIPEVTKMSQEEASLLILKGFEELKYSFKKGEEELISLGIKWITDCVPQRLHEYCLELAKVARPDRKLSLDHFPYANRAWLFSSMSNHYAVIEKIMNERSSKFGRRNQVLFSLGQIKTEQFKIVDLEDKIRTSFPNSSKDVTLNVSGLLSDLAKRKDAIVKKSLNGDSYTFTDPKFKMCLRAMLSKNNDETISRIDVTKI